MKVRRVDISPHVAHSRISLHHKISGLFYEATIRCCVRIAVLSGFRNSSFRRHCARLREVLPSANHPTGFRPVRGYCKLASLMSKIIRRFRDMAADACPSTADRNRRTHYTILCLCAARVSPLEFTHFLARLDRRAKKARQPPAVFR